MQAPPPAAASAAGVYNGVKEETQAEEASPPVNRTLSFEEGGAHGVAGASAACGAMQPACSMQGDPHAAALMAELLPLACGVLGQVSAVCCGGRGSAAPLPAAACAPGCGWAKALSAVCN